MEVIGDKQTMRNWSRARRQQGLRLALVPTMGFLHAGHLSLVKEARKQGDVVVVSIYVNPAQFSPGEDLNIYPRDLEGDLKKLEPLDVDVVFNPYDLYVRDVKDTGGRPIPNNGRTISQNSSVLSYDERDLISHNCTKTRNQSLTSSLGHLGEQGHETWISVEKLAKPLCGQSRPIFFCGVTTVVAKLLNIVEPDVAVFGKKDYQQWRVICRMVRDLDFPVEVIGCDLLREPDGLAMSSRNVYLSPAERAQALSINDALRKVAAAVRNGTLDVLILTDSVRQAIVRANGRVDYVEIVDQESLEELPIINCPAVLCVAAWFGHVRLIDNVELQPQ